MNTTWTPIWSNDEFDAAERNGVIRLSRRSEDPELDPEATFWIAEDLYSLAMAARYPGKDF